MSSVRSNFISCPNLRHKNKSSFTVTDRTVSQSKERSHARVWTKQTGERESERGKKRIHGFKAKKKHWLLIFTFCDDMWYIEIVFIYWIKNLNNATNWDSMNSYVHNSHYTSNDNNRWPTIYVKTVKMKQLKYTKKIKITQGSKKASPRNVVRGQTRGKV